MRLFTNKYGDSNPSKIIIWILFFSLLILFVGCYSCSKVKCREGYQDGIIHNLSTDGIFSKTTEGSMISEGLQFSNGSGGGASGHQFYFTVKDPVVFMKIKNIPHGKRVRLYYYSSVSVWFPKGNSPNFVTNIEELE